MLELNYRYQYKILKNCCQILFVWVKNLKYHYLLLPLSNITTSKQKGNVKITSRHFSKTIIHTYISTNIHSSYSLISLQMLKYLHRRISKQTFRNIIRCLDIFSKMNYFPGILFLGNHHFCIFECTDWDWHLYVLCKILFEEDMNQHKCNIMQEICKIQEKLCD